MSHPTMIRTRIQRMVPKCECLYEFQMASPALEHFISQTTSCHYRCGCASRPDGESQRMKARCEGSLQRQSFKFEINQSLTQ